MATAQVARASQPLRRTRDAPRPSLGKRTNTNTNVDGAVMAMAMASSKRRKLDEPPVWDAEYILNKHKNKPASLIIHLHQGYFKFEGQDGSFSYDSEMKFVLEHIARQTIPHQMMAELLENNVVFYDGWLIVEVHNHRVKAGRGKGKDRQDSSQAGTGNKGRFSMHNYNAYITPSPYEKFPEAAAHPDKTPEKLEKSSMDATAPGRQNDDNCPQIYTVALRPTPLSQHHDFLILASTPADQLRNRKRAGDGATPNTAQPPTPSVSVPPTPISQNSRGQLGSSQKMCIDEDNIYLFEADVLIATNPPLCLAPADTPQEADRILDLLQHPLHMESPPSPKTRKKTTAEVEADDAHHQETERRMLIMDERIKPSTTGAGANETQGGAAALTFSRFKTIDMVRQKLEETERQKKEDDARAASEKKAAEEMAQVHQRQQAQQAMQQKREMALQMHQAALAARDQQPHQQQTQQAALLRARQQQQALLKNNALAQAQAQALQAHQHAQNQAQHHAHPQQQTMMQNQHQAMQQGGAVQVPQSSPSMRQQTPGMNSSPMVQQGGFPIAQTSSQGAGSPPRPTSAALQQHPMARQVSQQQGSRNATPQMAQGTPSMSQAVPNRQMSQTPRMQPGSPAVGMHQGTPVATAMQMQTPQFGTQPQFTPEQIAILQQRALAQAQQAQAGSPPQNMTPDQIQRIRQNQARNVQLQQAQRERARQLAMLQAQQAAMNNSSAQDIQNVQQRLAWQRSQQMQANQMQGSPAPGQAGSPGQMSQFTPQMGHAHPQQQGAMPDVSSMTPEQQQQYMIANARANDIAQERTMLGQQNQTQQLQLQQLQQLQQQQAQRNMLTQNPQLANQVRALIQTHGGVHNVPKEEVGRLPPAGQQMFMSAYNSSRAKMLQMQQAQNGNVEQVPAQQPNPQYLNQLRQQKAMISQQMGMQGQQPPTPMQHAGMNGMTAMSYQMGGQQQQQQQGFTGHGSGVQNGGDHLGPSFAAMQNALARGGQGG